MPAVRVVEVSKKYGSIVAVEKANLEIKNKEYVCIIGPSGCGKTTLIKCIEGIIEPTEGEIYIDDRPIGKIPVQDRRIGYVFQEIALFPHMSVYENVSYGPRVKGWRTTQAKTLVDEMLDMMVLQDRVKDFPDTLSGGARQKTAIARALSSGSVLLLFDEPLGSLDAKVRTVLRHELRKMAKDLELTAIHVTHDQEEAMAIADRIVVMKTGKIVEMGRPIDLYLHPKKLFTANFVGEANFMIGEISSIVEKRVKMNINGDVIGSTNEINPEVLMKKEIVAVIRPEFVEIKKSGKNRPATITNKILIGSSVRYETETEQGELLAIRQPITFESQKWNVGDKVYLGFPPSSVLIYPYPEQGLENEISVE